MSDAQLAVFIRLILLKLYNVNARIQLELPKEFRVSEGQKGWLVNPLTYSYPILNPLVELIEELQHGLNELENRKT